MTLRGVVFSLAAIVVFWTITRPNLVSASEMEGYGSTPTAKSIVDDSLKTNTSAETPDIAFRSAATNFAVTTNIIKKQFIKMVGGMAQSRPCCTSWGPGRVDCFIQGPRANVLHISVENGVYGEWNELDGAILSDIECVSRDVGIIDLFVLDTDLLLTFNTFANGQWTGWQSAEGWYQEIPSCVSLNSTVVDCLSRGLGNDAYHNVFINGKMISFECLHGCIWAPIACSVRSPDKIDCFSSEYHYPGGSLQLQVMWWNASHGWSSWERLGGRINGRPSVTSYNENRIDVFAMGVTTRSIMQKTFENGAWKEWVDLGGAFDSEPECVTTGVGKIYCFAVGQGSFLYINSFVGKSWSGWARSYGRYLETPSCVVSNKDEVTCACRRCEKDIAFLTYNFI